MAKRLGGRPGGQLDREERLEKLMSSCAYGGASVAIPATFPQGKTSVQGKAPAQAKTPARPKATSRRLSGSVGASRPSHGLPRSGGNIHTLGGESRLTNTTESYRQQQGTTAKTLSEVGYRSMTSEKMSEVDKARQKVHGHGTAQRSCSVPTRHSLFSGRGHKMLQSPSKGFEKDQLMIRAAG
mmetsp:Transcript_15057/g.26078  ORF Transcript_15057/g.26078 Transcript_15057/m.26078 type:complete len:183 (-) Transcript_15057:120-668(-)